MPSNQTLLPNFFEFPAGSGQRIAGVGRHNPAARKYDTVEMGTLRPNFQAVKKKRPPAWFCGFVVFLSPQIRHARKMSLIDAHCHIKPILY